MKGTEYFVSLQTGVVVTEEYNVMVNSEKLIGTTENLTLETGCLINRCRYNGVRLYVPASAFWGSYWEEQNVLCILIDKLTGRGRLDDLT